MECHQPIHCMPGFGNLGCVAPFVSHSHLQLWWALPDLAPLTLCSATASASQAGVGSRTLVCWLVAWDPLGLQLSSDHAFPGFQVHCPHWERVSVHLAHVVAACCAVCSVNSVFLCLVWCPALPGCFFASSGRSEEGSRARCSAGIDQPWCVYISEMLPF